MANAFNLTAQINLRGPGSSAIRPIVADIKRQLGTIKANVDLKIDNKASKSISNITSRLTAMNNILTQARSNAEALSATFQNLSNSLSSIRQSSGQASASIKNLNDSTKSSAKNIAQATSAMAEFGKQSGLAIKRFAAYSIVTSGIYGLVNAVTDGFSAFVRFDKELVKLQQVTGKSATGLRDLENQITRLSVNLGVSSESLIGVASTLAQAGLSAEETRVAIEALAKTELAPSFDSLADTTEGAIAAMRQFGIAAGDLEGALGSINAVAAAFAVESSDIIAAIQRTGGVFASASKGVSEGTDALNEFIAVFTSVRATTRESAETIATGLRTIFTRIQRAKTIDQLQEFGVQLTDLEGKFVGPFEAVKRLSAALNQLDPRDIRFAQIVEELGGFRQIGKVIPLIQQFAEAQKALAVAQKGQGSLAEAQAVAQLSLANRLAKVREQFLALIRDIGKSDAFQALAKGVLSLTSGLLTLVGAFKPVLPILAIIGAIKGFKAATQFSGGFLSAFKKGGGARGAGEGIGTAITGGDRERAEATSKAAEAIRLNTTAINNLTTAINALASKIGTGGTTLSGGGKVLGFNKGGMVPGNGGGDRVPAFLEGGEIVMNRRAVKAYGAGNLLRMNKYAGGGKIIVDYPDESISTKVIDSALATAINDVSSQLLPSRKSIKGSTAKKMPNYAGVTGSIFEAGLARASEEQFVDDRKTFDFPSGINNVQTYSKLSGITSDAKRNFYQRGGQRDDKGNILRKIGNITNFDFNNQQKNFGVAVMNKGQDFDFDWTPDLVNQAKNNKKNLGGKIQKFMAGGVAEEYYGQTEVAAARSAYEEFQRAAEEALNLENIYFEIPEAKSIAEGVTPEVYGTGIGALAKGQPGIIGTKQVKFGATNSNAQLLKDLKVMQASMREAALKAREAQLEAYAQAEESISAFKKSGLLENIDPGIVSYIQDTIANLRDGTIDPEIWDAKSVKKITKKLSKPNLEAFDKLAGKDKIKVSVQGQRTQLGEVFNRILETYGSEVSQSEQSNITSKIADITLKQMTAQKANSGGIIQKFMAGGVAEEKKPISDDIIKSLRALGGKTGIVSYYPSPTDKGEDRLVGERVREAVQAAETKAASSGISSRQLFNTNVLAARPDGSILEAVLRTVIEQTEAAKKAKQQKKADQLSRNEQAAAGQAYQFGLVSLYGPNGELGYSDISDAKELVGRDGTTKYLAQIVRKSLPTRYADAVKKIQEDIAGLPARGAEQFQYTDIFGFGGPLAFDFDDTLVKGADIFAPNGDIDTRAYNDLNQVKEALANSQLTLLGKELAKRLIDYPQLMDSIRVLTARPPNNAPLLASKLASLGLPIPESKITGVTGGLNKVENLSEMEMLIDDNLENIQAILGAGKQGYLYREPQKMSAANQSSQRAIAAIEGYDLEEIIKQLGVGISSDDANPLRPIDYPKGLGASANIWGIKATLPTDTKRTNDSSALSRLWAEAQRYFTENFAFGGRADGSSFEEVKKQILEKYPQINFRISKRKRGFGYNILGGLKQEGDNVGNYADFQQASNLTQLSEVADKMANQLQYVYGPNIDPSLLKKKQKKFALGGLAEATGEMTGLMQGLYGNKTQEPAKTDKKEKQFGRIGLRDDGTTLSATYFKNDQRSGNVSAFRMRDYLYYVGLSQATGGYGPRLYDVIMEAATSKGAMLTSDRSSVSGDAKRVWEYYFKNRGDVKKTPLKPDDWTRNQSLLDPKLYGPEDTWPPTSDLAWVLQTGYSKTPSLINDPNSVIRMDKQIDSRSLASNYFAASTAKLAKGGSAQNTIPAMVSNQEGFVPPKLAKKIGYAKLDRMNQADRNGMTGFAEGGISKFKGPGSGTSDSIGPIGLPKGSYVIRAKAMKALGLNKGGIVGGLKRFFRGGIADKDVARAQGTVLTDVKQAEKTFAIIMGQLGKNIRESIIRPFKGIEDVEAGQDQKLIRTGRAFTEGTRGRAAMTPSATAMGLQIGGQKAKATTETVAHEAGHLADYQLGGGKGSLASETAGTFQFAIVEKIKPVMEKAFLDAGKDAKEVANYLTTNKELFAEFFAKASPQVRSIITSTTDAAIGMKALADHLGDAGYTYAGLEASDITNNPVAKAQASIVSTSVSPASPPVPPTPPSPPAPPGSPPVPPVGPKTPKATADVSAYMSFQADKAGKTLEEFNRSLLYAAQAIAKQIPKELAAAQQSFRAELSGLSATAQKSATTKDPNEYKKVLSLISSRIKEIDSTKTDKEADKISRGITAALAKGQNIDDIISANTELRNILTRTLSGDDIRQRALGKAATDAGLNPDAIKLALTEDLKKGVSGFQKLIDNLGGPLKATSLVFAGVAGAAALVKQSFADAGKQLSAQTTALLSSIEALSVGFAVTANLDIAKNIKGFADTLDSFGSRSLSKVSGLLKNIAGPIQTAAIAFTTVSSAIGAYYNSLNESNLQTELQNLSMASDKTANAFKALEQNASAANISAAKDAMAAESASAEALRSRGMIDLRTEDKSWMRTAAKYDPTGLISSTMGLPQEAEARKAYLDFEAKQMGQFRQLGSERIKRVKPQEIEASAATARAFDAELGRLDIEREALKRTPGSETALAAKNKQIEETRARKAESLYTTSQTFATMRESGINEQDILRRVYLEAAPTSADREERLKAIKGESGKTEEERQTNKQKAIAAAKQLLAIEAENEQVQRLMADAYKEVQLETENLIRTYERASALLTKFGQSIDLIKQQANIRAGAIQGQAQIGPIDRTSENILNNMGAYSQAQVEQAAMETSMMMGGGVGGEQVRSDIVAAKIINEQLPNILSRTGSLDAGAAIDELRKAFNLAGVELSDAVAGELEASLQKEAQGREGVSFKDFEANSNIVQEVQKKAAASLKIAQEFQKQYNDALSVAIEATNEYGKALQEATDYQLKASDIRIRSELDLAQALRKSLSLSDLDKPLTSRVTTLSSGVIQGGTSDPKAIFAGMMAAINNQPEQQKELERRKSAFAQDNSDANRVAVEEQMRNMAQQNVAINNSRKALEELANDSTAASEALKGLAEQQEIARGSVNFMQKILTSDSDQLQEINKGLAAYTKVISGRATGQEMNSLEFRRNAFAGLENISSMMPETLRGQMQAQVTRQMLESTAAGRQLLATQTGGLYRGADGQMKKMTYGEALKMAETGEDPKQKEFIDAYKAATERQAQAADMLGNAALAVADTFNTQMINVLKEIQDKLPTLLKDAIKGGMQGEGTKSDKQQSAFEDLNNAVVAMQALDKTQAASMGISPAQFKTLSTAYSNVEKAKAATVALEKDAAARTVNAATGTTFAGTDNILSDEEYQQFKDSPEYLKFKTEAPYIKAKKREEETQTRFNELATEISPKTTPADTQAAITDYRNSPEYLATSAKVEEERKKFKESMLGEPPPYEGPPKDASLRADMAGVTEGKSDSDRQKEAAATESENTGNATAALVTAAGTAFAAAIGQALLTRGVTAVTDAFINVGSGFASSIAARLGMGVAASAAGTAAGGAAAAARTTAVAAAASGAAGGAAGGAAPSGAADDVARAVSGATDDVAKAASGADDLAKATANAADDVARLAQGASAFSKVLTFLGKVATPLAVVLGGASGATDTTADAAERSLIEKIILGITTGSASTGNSWVGWAAGSPRDSALDAAGSGWGAMAQGASLGAPLGLPGVLAGTVVGAGAETYKQGTATAQQMEKLADSNLQLANTNAAITSETQQKIKTSSEATEIATPNLSRVNLLGGPLETQRVKDQAILLRNIKLAQSSQSLEDLKQYGIDTTGYSDLNQYTQSMQQKMAERDASRKSSIEAAQKQNSSFGSWLWGYKNIQEEGASRITEDERQKAIEEAANIKLAELGVSAQPVTTAGPAIPTETTAIPEPQQEAAINAATTTTEDQTSATDQLTSSFLALNDAATNLALILNSMNTSGPTSVEPTNMMAGEVNLGTDSDIPVDMGNQFDPMNQLAQAGLQMGSIFTHDVTNEKLLGQLLTAVGAQIPTSTNTLMRSAAGIATNNPQLLSGAVQMVSQNPQALNGLAGTAAQNPQAIAGLLDSLRTALSSIIQSTNLDPQSLNNTVSTLGGAIGGATMSEGNSQQLLAQILNVLTEIKTIQTNCCAGKSSSDKKTPSELSQEKDPKEQAKIDAHNKILESRKALDQARNNITMQDGKAIGTEENIKAYNNAMANVTTATQNYKDLLAGKQPATPKEQQNSLMSYIGQGVNFVSSLFGGQTKPAVSEQQTTNAATSSIAVNNQLSKSGPLLASTLSTEQQERYKILEAKRKKGAYSNTDYLNKDEREEWTKLHRGRELDHTPSRTDNARRIALMGISGTDRTPEQQQEYMRLQYQYEKSKNRTSGSFEDFVKAKQAIQGSRDESRYSALTEAGGPRNKYDEKFMKDYEARQQKTNLATAPAVTPTSFNNPILTQQNNRLIQPTSITIPQQPVPSTLPTINRPVTTTATAVQPTSPQSSPTGMPNVIKLDNKAMEFVTKFGEFVNQLSQIKIPSVIEVKGGNHTVDVRVSGAAAFEALQEGVKGLINDAISDAMSTIHTQSLGVLGAPKSKNAKTKSGNQGENTQGSNNT